MSAILRTPDEIEARIPASWEGAKRLQRPLPAGILKIVSVVPKEDAAANV
jgi:hypothetical protein